MIFTLFRAEDGAQTRDPQLGRLMLYRLSYFRKIKPSPRLIPPKGESYPPFGEEGRGFVGSEGFEPPKSKDS